MPPQIVPSEDNVTDVACDALVVGAHSRNGSFALSPAAQRIDAALDGYLSEHLEDISFKAKPAELAVVPTMRSSSAKSIVVAGLGPQDGDGTGQIGRIRRAAGAAARRLSGSHADIATTLHEGHGGEAAAAVAEGFLLGSYRYTKFKSDPRPSKIQRIALLGAQADDAERGTAIGEATLTARDLINEPAHSLTPEALARRAQEIADVSGLSCTVLDEGEIEARGLNGVITVGKGAANKPRFIELSYDPGKASGHVALVGKGVTFDSGGLSLKPAASMETMKTDMSGAAAVLGTMSVVAKLGIGTAVKAYIPAVENMPGGNAVRPGDVIKHYGGKTSEVLNTDAEGRLILADALALASEDKPVAIVDAATLTGSIHIALGGKIGGLFCNDDTLAAELQAAADQAGEPLWRMPLFQEYRKQLDSEVADMRNVGTRYGGSIVAALFLKEFVAEGIPWAHLDIAGVARSDNDDDRGPKGGTGAATATLLSWLQSRAS
ncbi:MAG: leucyl aminopeptidase [Actinomycetota bacterium]